MTEAGLRHSPLERVHRDLGAKLGPFGGWLMPIEYQGTLSEHRAVRDGAGLFDLSHLGKVDVVGPTAFAALQTLLTNDLRTIDVGRAQYHHLLDDEGGVLEDLFVYRLAEERWFVVPNASNTDLVVAAVREAAGSDAVLDHDDWCFLGVQGPASLEVVGALWPRAADLEFRGCCVVERAGREVVLARTGYTGERGYEVFADAALAGELWSAFMQAGARVPIRPCGLGARDVLRLEMGYPLYGQDLGPEHTSFEAGLGWAVALDKGDFRGREGLLRRRSASPTARLGGLRTTDRRHIPRAHQAVSVGGETVGEVTSGTFSPTLGAGIALAYLTPAERFEPGAEVEVDIRGRAAAATVVETPFVDRSPR